MKYLIWDEFKKNIEEEYKGIKKFRLFTLKQMMNTVRASVHPHEWHPTNSSYDNIAHPSESGWYLITTDKGFVERGFYLPKDETREDELWLGELAIDDKGEYVARKVKAIAWTDLPEPFSASMVLKALFGDMEDEE